MALFDRIILINAAQSEVAAAVRASTEPSDTLHEIRPNSLLLVIRGGVGLVYLLGTDPESGMTKLRFWLDKASVVKGAFDGRPLGESFKALNEAQTPIRDEQRAQLERIAVARLEELKDRALKYRPDPYASVSEDKHPDQIGQVRKSRRGKKRDSRLAIWAVTGALAFIVLVISWSSISRGIQLGALSVLNPQPVALNHDLFTLTHPSTWANIPVSEAEECETAEGFECLIALGRGSQAYLMVLHFENFKPPLSESEMRRLINVDFLTSNLAPLMEAEGIIITAPNMMQVGGYDAYAADARYEGDNSVGWFYLVATPRDLLAVVVAFRNNVVRDTFATEARGILESIQFVA